MTRDFCICTGWCASATGHSNPKRSKLIDKPEWLLDHWGPYIRRFVNGSMNVFVYVSNCDIPSKQEEWWQDLHAFYYIDTLPYHHDCWAGHLAGAMYSYLNNMDFVYIEQDCFVYRLDKSIQWARDQQAKVCFNLGDPYCYAPGWAATSFVYVSCEYLPTYINRMMQSGIKDNGGKPLVHEVMFGHLYKEDYTNWPFGYDRKRPIDWTLPMFYAQQLSDEEIERFQAL